MRYYFFLIFLIFFFLVSTFSSCSKKNGGKGAKEDGVKNVHFFIQNLSITDLTRPKERPQVDSGGVKKIIKKILENVPLIEISSEEKSKSKKKGVPFNLHVAIFYGFTDKEGYAVLKTDDGFFLCGTGFDVEVNLDDDVPQIFSLRSKFSVKYKKGDTLQQVFDKCITEVLSLNIKKLQFYLKVLFFDDRFLISSLKKVCAGVDREISEKEFVEKLKKMGMDKDAFLFLLGEVGERKIKKSVSCIIKILKNVKMREVLLKGIGVLGMIGSDEAVPYLASLTKGEDFAVINLAIDSIFDIGGKKARFYLKNIMETTPFTDVKKRCEDLLKQLETR